MEGFRLRLGLVQCPMPMFVVRQVIQSNRLTDLTSQATGGIDGVSSSIMSNPWASLSAPNPAQSSTAPQNQEMDLDLDVQEEEQVSELLSAPMFRIVIPGTKDPESQILDVPSHVLIPSP